MVSFFFPSVAGENNVGGAAKHSVSPQKIKKKEIYVNRIESSARRVKVLRRPQTHRR